MKKIITFLVFLSLLIIPQGVKTEGETMPKIYLVPIEQITVTGGSERGPEYFKWRFDANPPSINCHWSLMDYGFINVGLLVAHDITPTDHAALILHADVYAFPDNLDQPISDKATIDTFFEAVNIPTDWTTPSTTYRQLLRQMAGLFQFNQRYSGLSGGQSVFGNGITLDSNYNTMSAQQQTWFVQTLQSFGWQSGVQGNPKLRALAKQAGDLWGNKSFIMGGFTF